MRAMISLVVAAFCALLPSAAQAHKSSDSYLNVQIRPGRIEVQWDLGIRDLDYALGLDSNDDGAITWAEVKRHETDIARYACARLKMSAGDVTIPLARPQFLIDEHSDGAYVVLRFASRLATNPAGLEVGYRAFFDLDAQHRGLLRLDAFGEISSGIFSPDRSTQRFALDHPQPWAQWAGFVRQGVWHIWIGLDHILFLIALLLPAVLLRADNRWAPAESFWSALINVLKVVTSFTVAHSLTLGLATFGVIRLPSRLVESMIAASVILAALHNFFPILKGKGWAAAFGFGLIHGFGFANVLADLGLNHSTLRLALLGFNVGVELGQLAIVSTFLPVAYGLRRLWLYQGLVFRFGSAFIALTAGVWLFERMFDLQLPRF